MILKPDALPAGVIRDGLLSIKVILSDDKSPLLVHFTLFPNLSVLTIVVLFVALLCILKSLFHLPASLGVIVVDQPPSGRLTCQIRRLESQSSTTISPS